MYNAAATIERCLGSITAQTRAVAKILVVDDGSTDDSAVIVRQLGIANLELLRTPVNGGAGAARNLGIARAETPFVAFLDADDVWRPNFVERVSDAIEQFDANYGSSGGIRGNWDGRVRARRAQPNGPAVVDLTNDFWRVAMRFMPTHSSATIVRKSLAEQVGGFAENVKLGEDSVFWARLWPRGRFAFVDEPLFESFATDTSLNSAAVSYHDVRLGLAAAGRALLDAIRLRKRGTDWFTAWYVRRVFNRHALWLRRKIKRPTPVGPRRRAA